MLDTPQRGEKSTVSDQTYPQAPPPGYQQQPPPKKSHTLRNVLLVVLLLGVLFVGGCLALIGGAANEVSKSIDKSIAEEAANDKPKDVTEGKAFTHDDYAVDAGWKVEKAEFGGGVTITNARVTNNAEEGRSAWLTFTFYNGKENLAEVSCTSNELQKGESSKLDCSSLSDEPATGYKTIKVADAF